MPTGLLSEVGGAWRTRTSVSEEPALQAGAVAAGPTRRKMVGQVGVEPTKSPRSERGAFANLTTARWSGRRDSNPHYAASQTADSASWPTSGEMVGPEGVEPSNDASFELAAYASSATGPWRRVRGSNSQVLSDRLFSRQLGLPAVPKLSELFSCTNGIELRQSRSQGSTA
jgi:hypothetical protein